MSRTISHSPFSPLEYNIRQVHAVKCICPSPSCRSPYPETQVSRRTAADDRTHSRRSHRLQGMSVLRAGKIYCRPPAHSPCRLPSSAGFTSLPAYHTFLCIWFPRVFQRRPVRHFQYIRHMARRRCIQYRDLHTVVHNLKHFCYHLPGIERHKPPPGSR